MKGDFILHVVNIVGTRMIESGIDGISGGNKLGFMMRGVNPLEFVPIDEGWCKYHQDWKGG